jgi:hypothetical protein
MTSSRALAGILIFAAYSSRADAQATAALGNQSARQPLSFVLSREAPSAAHLTFSIRNDGTEDATLLLGADLANGRIHMVSGLTLHVKRTGEEASDYLFMPLAYPAAIGGSVAEWLMALPAGGSFQMTVNSRDFFSLQPGGERLTEIPGPGELWLRWVIGAPHEADTRQRTALGGTWIGTLVSNRLTIP